MAIPPCMHDATGQSMIEVPFPYRIYGLTNRRERLELQKAYQLEGKQSEQISLIQFPGPPYTKLDPSISEDIMRDPTLQPLKQPVGCTDRRVGRGCRDEII